LLVVFEAVLPVASFVRVVCRVEQFSDPCPIWTPTIPGTPTVTPDAGLSVLVVVVVVLSAIVAAGSAKLAVHARAAATVSLLNVFISVLRGVARFISSCRVPPEASVTTSSSLV
jgi:hypothetical protein